jgi:cobalt-zinc-cadmium efflux system outer membrane protein
MLWTGSKLLLCMLATGGAVAPGPLPADTTAELQAAAQTDLEDLPELLSLAQAEEIFLQRGYDLLLAEATVHSAAGDLQSAAAIANPQLTAAWGRSFTYDPLACTTPGCSATAISAQLGDGGALTDVLIGKRRLRKHIAQAAYTAAGQLRDDARRTLLNTLRTTFLAVAIDEAQLEFARQVQQTYAHTLKLFSLRYQAGAVSETDLARIETAALQADSGVDDALGSREIDRLALMYLLGERDTLQPFTLATDWLEQTTQAPLMELKTAQLLSTARQLRPDVLAAQAQQMRAQRGLDLGYRLRFPDLSWSLLFAGQGHGQSAVSPPVLSLGLSVTPPLFYQMQGEISRAQADVRAQDIGLQKTLGQVSLDVQSAQCALHTSGEKLSRMRTRLRARAARALELVQLQYTKGAASLLELLDAQRTYIAINQEYYANLESYWNAVFALRATAGLEMAP